MNIFFLKWLRLSFCHFKFPSKDLKVMTHNVDSIPYWVLCSCLQSPWQWISHLFQMSHVFSFANLMFCSFSPHYSRYYRAASLLTKEQIQFSHLHPSGARRACWFLSLDSVIIFSSQWAVHCFGSASCRVAFESFLSAGILMPKNHRHCCVLNKFALSDKAWKTDSRVCNLQIWLQMRVNLTNSQLIQL